MVILASAGREEVRPGEGAFASRLTHRQGAASDMYQFSRAIYRELAPFVVEDRPPSQRQTNRELVLRECECAIERLMLDRRYFAAPTRTLFNAVRAFFAMGDLPRVYLAIDRNVRIATEFVTRDPEYIYEQTGMQRSCQ